MAISPRTTTARPFRPRASLRSRRAVLLQPGEHLLVPELAVLRLEHPVPLVREVDEPARHLLPLQGREQLVSLADGAPEVQIVLDHQGRRLVLAQVPGPLVWGEVGVRIRLLPR